MLELDVASKRTILDRLASGPEKLSRLRTRGLSAFDDPSFGDFEVTTGAKF